jgi:hypothetical protein
MKNSDVSGVTISLTRYETEWLGWVVREVLGDSYRERATPEQLAAMDKILETVKLLKNIDQVMASNA